MNLQRNTPHPVSGMARGSRAVTERRAVTTESTIGRGDVITANAENRYEVTRNDLPLCCPMPGMSLWNSHPKVYLPIEETGTAKCPYCGAVYVLKS